MRGRLIHQFVLELAQLDTRATEMSLPEGGYDPVFREPRLVDDGTQAGRPAREERLTRIAAQVEPEVYNAARVLAAGRVRDARVVVLLHARDLENACMMRHGAPTLRIGDRLAAIRDRDGCVAVAIPTPPGLYLRSITPRGFGFGTRVNLYELEFTPRTQGR